MPAFGPVAPPLSLGRAFLFAFPGSVVYFHTEGGWTSVLSQLTRPTHSNPKTIEFVDAHLAEVDHPLGSHEPEQPTTRTIASHPAG